MDPCSSNPGCSRINCIFWRKNALISIGSTRRIGFAWLQYTTMLKFYTNLDTSELKEKLKHSLRINWLCEAYNRDHRLYCYHLWVACFTSFISLKFVMNFCNPNALFSQKQMLHIYHHIPVDTDLFICVREFVNVCLCEWVRACVCASLWMAVSLHLWPFVHVCQWLYA